MNGFKAHRIILILIAFFFLTACRQEKYIFHPTVLAKDYQFQFRDHFVEKNIKVDSTTFLNGLWFKADSSKGLIYYLHGNAGALNSWGRIADLYLKNRYDIFILDYRGFGKSEGQIESEKQLFSDIQIVYDTLTHYYEEDKISIIGFSIGSGLAAHLASENHPKRLILKAPYYSLSHLTHQYVPVVPSFMLRYKIHTDQYIEKVKCPIIIFHGDQDEVINYQSSVKLKAHFKTGDTLFTLNGQSHNGINSNEMYIREMERILK